MLKGALVHVQLGKKDNDSQSGLWLEGIGEGGDNEPATMRC